MAGSSVDGMLARSAALELRREQQQGQGLAAIGRAGDLSGGVGVQARAQAGGSQRAGVY